MKIISQLVPVFPYREFFGHLPTVRQKKKVPRNREKFVDK